MGKVPVPHFGVHLDPSVFNKIKENIKKNNIQYLDEPYTRFKGKKEQQETFFIKDPHGNILELKTLNNS
jgi:extradiol dioxygenase family protein